MTLSDLSIRRPVFAWMLMAALVVFGFISWTRLGVSEQPDVDFPVLTINAKWTGAAPEVMESEIVDRLEEAVISTQGIRDILSSIQQGQAAITIEFDLNRNVDAALTEVQSKISSVGLPIGADQPTITKNNPEDQAVLILAVSGSRDAHALTEYVERSLEDQFKIVPGVGAVTLGGYNERNLRVWIDNKKLKPLQLTILDVRTAIEQEHVEVAAGYIENKQSELNVRTMGEGLTAEAIGNLQIKKRGGENIYNSRIRIKDVAQVVDDLDDVRRLAVVPEGQVIGLGIKKQRGANAVAVAQAVKAKLAELRPALPPDIKIDVVFDTTKFIEEAIHETIITLLLSALITGVVCFLFLGTLSSTLNVLLSIPTSVMGTFIVMYFMGFTLNFFTLLGLSLAIGIVVDDAIMVLENIVRHFEMGKNAVNASLDGAREITFAAVAATAAVMAIFLPVAFMHGIIGKFFFQFGVTISAAVAISLLEAITITPMRCSQLLRRNDRPGPLTRLTNFLFGALARAYRGTLGVALRFRWLVLAGCTALFVWSLSIIPLLPKEFVPKQDQGLFLLRLQTPVGSSLEFTRQRLVQVTKILGERPDIARYFAVIGGFTQDGGAPEGSVTDDEVNAATVYVTLKPAYQLSAWPLCADQVRDFKDYFTHKNPKLEWPIIQFPDALMASLREPRQRANQYVIMDEIRHELAAISDLTVVPQDLSTRGFTAQRGFPIELTMQGSDHHLLEQKTNELIAAMKESGFFVDIDTDFRNGMPEIRVWPDRAAASAAGVSIDSIAATVSSAIGGTVQGKFTNQDRRYNLRLRLKSDQRLEPADVAKLDVRTAYGEMIPISSVVSLEKVSTYQTISRRLRQKSISIFSNVAPGKSQAEALDVAQALGAKILPPGTKLALGGAAATFRETFDSLSFALWLGVVVAYMVLASQFNSYVHPFTVLLALPFSVIGAVWALKLMGLSINLYSMIGLVLLMGIVKKNSILVVEFANQMRYREGLNVRDALLVAGPVRLRPILMTSVATLAAAIPPALSIGPGAESRVPLAVTVIGGVLVSTFFTLLAVPCAYSLLAHLERGKPDEPKDHRGPHHDPEFLVPQVATTAPVLTPVGQSLAELVPEPVVEAKEPTANPSAPDLNTVEPPLTPAPRPSPIPATNIPIPRPTPAPGRNGSKR